MIFLSRAQEAEPRTKVICSQTCPLLGTYSGSLCEGTLLVQPTGKNLNALHSHHFSTALTYTLNKL